MAVVTLLTDFGLTDSYVAEVKAVLVSAQPAVQIIDISHAVPAGDVFSAQYLLDRSWRRFPAGTVHVVVVDPGVGSPRRAVAAHREGHWFVAPDNGVLSPVLDGARVSSLPVPAGASPTFHGRDLFAPAAARLVGGATLPELGSEIHDPFRLPVDGPRRENGGVTGRVVYVDHFGTLITNIPGSWVDSTTLVQVGNRSARISRTFSDVPPGELVALVGSGGTVELAIRGGSAARGLGKGTGERVFASQP